MGFDKGYKVDVHSNTLTSTVGSQWGWGINVYPHAGSSPKHAVNGNGVSGFGNAISIDRFASYAGYDYLYNDAHGGREEHIDVDISEGQWCKPIP